MKIKTAVFELSAPNLQACPASALPEFAFIGRSNVGKSSLINLLVARKDLAKVSATPGKTQLINFFRINDAWKIVDLPGYGYANVDRSTRADFNEAVADYLEERSSLRGVFVLIDSRLPPQRIDLDFVRWLSDAAVPHVLVFTKSDKQSAQKTQISITQFTASLQAWRATPPKIFTSSIKTKAGRSEILAFIETWRKAPAADAAPV